tara:strand:+ start:108 stop:278 length:171 start_codon:yes stop_codon:yes gene_type:complete
MEIEFTECERKKMAQIARGFAIECKTKGIDAKVTKEMLTEVMKATADCLLEDREKK